MQPLQPTDPSRHDLPDSTYHDPWRAERLAVVRALDMAALWQACVAWIGKALPCHSCSLLFDIEGYRPQQGRHHLAEAHDAEARLVTSLDVAAPYLDANPNVRWYTYSQIAGQDAQAAERLKSQDPAPAWREFIHLAFWSDTALDAVLSIRLHASSSSLGERELAFLTELHPLLEAGLQRVSVVEQERTRRQAVEAVLHELPIAAVLVDSSLVPFYMSQEARRICRRWSAGDEGKGRLPRELEVALGQWLAQRVRSAPASDLPLGQGERFELVHRSQPRLRLSVDVSSVARASGRDVHHLLVLQALDDAQPPQEELAPRALALLRGLSPSERRVALLVAAGLSNEGIALRLSRSRKTIESQISSIYRKLNVSSRTQLARLLS